MALKIYIYLTNNVEPTGDEGDIGHQIRVKQPKKAGTEDFQDLGRQEEYIARVPPHYHEPASDGQSSQTRQEEWLAADSEVA
jgi:hypothetical protein